jgi:YHS domain-containing protein
MKMPLILAGGAALFAGLVVLVAETKPPAPAAAVATAAFCAMPANATATTAAATPAAKPYPFSTSVVSGEKLGDPKSTVTFVQDGYQIRLASAAEEDTFKKTPAMYLAKITDAYKNARPCPMTVCPVMGDQLDDTAYSFVYDGREIKLCCDSCLDDFQKDPAKYVKMWDDAAAAKAAPAPTPAVAAKN